MRHRVFVKLSLTFLLLTTAAPALTDCNPADIAGTWYIVVRWDDGDGIDRGWSDCVLKFSKNGTIRNVSCVDLELGDRALGESTNLTGIITGRFKLNKSCRLTGQLITNEDGEPEDVALIRGSVSRNAEVMNGVFYEEESFPSINTFTGTKR